MINNSLQVALLDQMTWTRKQWNINKYLPSGFCIRNTFGLQRGHTGSWAGRELVTTWELSIMAAPTLKRLFSSLTLFGLLSVTCVIILLFLNQSTTSMFLKKHFHAMERISLSWKSLHVDEQRSMRNNRTNSSLERSTDRQPPLERCPDNPPHLVGGLLVEFNFKRTMEEVRRLYRSSIQKGGRYKPPDCVAQQKVCR